MPLFLATHRHPAETCPLRPETGDQVLSHVSAGNAARYGVTIQGEAVVEGEHRLVLILQASGRAEVERFLAFLERFGSVEILRASSSEVAIARGTCGVTPSPAAVW